MSPGPICIAPGCTRLARKLPYARYGFSGYCSMHMARLRLRGTLTPRLVKRNVLEEYVRRVTRVIERADSPVIDTALRTTAGALIDAAKDLGEHSHVGKWVRLWSLRACDEVLRVLDSIGSVRSGLTVAAVFLLRDEHPAQFDSDVAFRFELCRLWRSQTSLSTGSTWDANHGRMNHWYKTLPARTTAGIAQLLVDAYAPFASLVIAAEKRMAARPNVARHLLRDVLTSESQS